MTAIRSGQYLALRLIIFPRFTLLFSSTVKTGTILNSGATANVISVIDAWHSGFSWLDLPSQNPASAMPKCYGNNPKTLFVSGSAAYLLSLATDNEQANGNQ
jgi:hypothetical protein